MLFKLVIPQTNRQIQGGSIIKWHKAEGEWVDFGDDLFDYRVDEINLLRKVKKENIRKWEVSLRVTSSDMGVLHKIHAAEGTYRNVGEVVAVLAMSEDELVSDPDLDLDQAPVFRVVANVIDELS